jgi:hypothetical protein
MPKPKVLEDMDLDHLIEQCQEYIDFIDSDEYHEDGNDAHYIFEAAMMAVFGNDVFKWVNKRVDEHESEDEYEKHDIFD